MLVELSHLDCHFTTVGDGDDGDNDCNDDCNYDGSDGGDGDIGGDNDDTSGDVSDDTDDKQKINHRDVGQLIWPVRDFQMDTAACKIPQVVETLLHFLSEAVTLFVSS